MVDREKWNRKIIPIREGLFRIPSQPGETFCLLGSRCKTCGQLSFPPRKVCSKCFSDEMEILPLSTKGRLYSYTIAEYPAPGLLGPYAIGYVDLPEGVRVFSILEDWDRKSLRVGMDVELTLGKFREDKEGNEIVTYKFRPIPSSDEETVL
jgi:benzoylsuccinyl-CoA thiolase BbsA subunit